MESPPTSREREEIQSLLGRVPVARYRIVVRDARGSPVVIENMPFTADGTPMPTLYWLVGRAERDAVGSLEAGGGVRDAEHAVDEGELIRAHKAYGARRDAGIAPGHSGPVPSGGVGGTRRGVKCLHAHLAYHLAGGDDPVGRWAAQKLGIDANSYVVSPCEGGEAVDG